jgi:hypothetical protein
MGRKKPTPEQVRKLDKLAKALKDVPPERLRTILRKDSTLQIRVSEREKVEIQQAAERRGATVSAYLLSLHDRETQRGG